LKSNGNDGGFGGSDAGAELEEVPNAGLGAEFLVNPKLNLGAGALVVGPVVVDPFWDALVPADLAGPLVFDRLKANEALVESFAVLDGPNADMGLAGSAPGTFVFPNENGEPLGVVLWAVNDCGVANPPIRPNNDPPLSEL